MKNARPGAEPTGRVQMSKRKVPAKSRQRNERSELEALIAEQANDRDGRVKRERAAVSLDEQRLMPTDPAPAVRRINAKDVPRSMQFNDRRGRLERRRYPKPRGLEAIRTEEAKFRGLAERVIGRLQYLARAHPEGFVAPRAGHLAALEKFERAINDDWKWSLVWSLEQYAIRTKELELRRARPAKSFGDLPAPETAAQIYERVRRCQGVPRGLNAGLIAALLPRVRLGAGGPGGGLDPMKAAEAIELAARDPKAAVSKIKGEDSRKRRRAERSRKL